MMKNDEGKTVAKQRHYKKYFILVMPLKKAQKSQLNYCIKGKLYQSQNQAEKVA